MKSDDRSSLAPRPSTLDPRLNQWIVFRCPGCRNVYRWGSWVDPEKDARMKAEIAANTLAIEFVETTRCPACEENKH